MLQLNSGDTWPSLKRQLLQAADVTDPDSVVVYTDPISGARYKALDLTGCTVTFQMEKAGVSGLLTKSVTVLDQTTGWVEVPWVSSDTTVTVTTDCIGRFRVTDGALRHFSVPSGDPIRIRIVKDVDGNA